MIADMNTGTNGASIVVGAYVGSSVELWKRIEIIVKTQEVV